MSAAPEFSRPVASIRLNRKNLDLRVEAEPAERAALAARFGLLELDSLTADVALSRGNDSSIRLDGQLDATLSQSCIVTLEPVPATLSDRFTLIFMPDIDDETADRLTFEAEGDVVVEPLAGDSIDIGEAVAQQLALVIDPYPRAPGAASTDEDAEFGTEGKRNPFEVLASFKPKA